MNTSIPVPDVAHAAIHRRLALAALLADALCRVRGRRGLAACLQHIEPASENLDVGEQASVDRGDEGVEHGGMSA